MNKNYMAIAVALLFVAVASASSVTADTPDPVQDLTVSIGRPSADHAGGYEEWDCDPEPQTAVLVADVPGCGDFGGEHTVGGFGYIIVGFRSVNAGNAGAVPLTGTLRAHLTSDSGEVDFQCTWNGGQFSGCQILSAQWPPIGSTFEYECHSTEGAVGQWGECYLGHE